VDKAFLIAASSKLIMELVKDMSMEKSNLALQG
jgi:hypothetical protein